MFPFMSIAAPILGGMFGGPTAPQLSPQAEWAANFLKRLAKMSLNDSNSVPLSLPGEQAALAESKGLAGEEYRNSHQNLLAAMGTNGPDSGNGADAMKNFEENRMGGLMNMDSQALMQALQRRVGLRGQAGGFAGQAGGIGAGANQPGYGAPDFSSLFQQIGQHLGQQGGQPAAPASGYQAPSSSVAQNSVFSGGGYGNYDPQRYRTPPNYFNGNYGG